MDEQDRAASSSGLRARIDAVRALRGLRGHVIRALIPAVALAVVAGGTAGAVTIVSLAGTEVTVVDDAEGDTSGDASGTSGDASVEDDATDADAAGESALPTSSTSSSSEDGEGDEDAGGDEADEDATDAAPVVLTFEEAVAKHGRPDYSAILTRRFPGALWSLNGNDSVNGLVWNSSGPKPTQSELDALWPAVAEELAAERAAQEADEDAAAAAREAELEARRNDPDVQALLDSCDPRVIWGSPDYAHILTRRFPGALWSLNGNDPVNGLVWNSSGPKPTKAELDAMWADVAREMALEMDPKELARWCGTGDEVYVDGVLRPRGWVGGADDPQPDPPAITRDNCSIMPFLPNDGGGKTIDVWKDPTGSKNFEMVIGISFSELMFRVAEAHGFWGDQYCGVGLGVSSNRTTATFRWRSSQVNESIIVSILTSLGALPANPPATAPEPDPEPSPEATEDDGTTEATEDGTADGDTGTDPDAATEDGTDDTTADEDDEDDDGAED